MIWFISNVIHSRLLSIVHAVCANGDLHTSPNANYEQPKREREGEKEAAHETNVASTTIANQRKSLKSVYRYKLRVKYGVFACCHVYMMWRTRFAIRTIFFLPQIAFPLPNARHRLGRHTVLAKHKHSVHNKKKSENTSTILLYIIRWDHQLIDTNRTSHFHQNGLFLISPTWFALARARARSLRVCLLR